MPIPELQALKIYNDANVTTVTTPNSIPPDIVGGITDDLIDAIEPYLEIELNRQYWGGSTAPSDLDGSDGDVYFYADGSNNVVVYQKISGSWAAKGSFSVDNSGQTIPVQLDSNGEYDFSGSGIGEFPNVTIYDSTGNTASYFYNNTTKKVTNGVPGENITVRFT